MKLHTDIDMHIIIIVAVMIIITLIKKIKKAKNFSYYMHVETRQLLEKY